MNGRVGAVEVCPGAVNGHVGARKTSSEAGDFYFGASKTGSGAGNFYFESVKTTAGAVEEQNGAIEERFAPDKINRAADIVISFFNP